MRRIGSTGIVSLALALLGGCSDYGTRSYGVGRGAPEQTRVTTPAPLSLPPILTEARSRTDAPPAAGPNDTAPTPTLAPTARAAEANAPLSSGEESLLDAAGPSAPGDIRDRVDQDAQIGRADPSYSDALIFGPLGPRTGQPPIIQRETKSWYDDIF